MTQTPTRKEPARLTSDLVITIVLVVVFAAALLATTAWPFRTALFPTIVSGAALLLSLAHLLTLLVCRRRGVPAEEAEPVTEHDVIALESESADDEADYVFATAGRQAWLSALAWGASFFFALYVLGLLIAAPLFSFAYQRFSARRSWLSSILYAVVVLVAVYLAFESVLTIPIPSPIWEES